MPLHCPQAFSTFTGVERLRLIGRLYTTDCTPGFSWSAVPVVLKKKKCFSPESKVL